MATSVTEVSSVKSFGGFQKVYSHHRYNIYVSSSKLSGIICKKKTYLEVFKLLLFFCDHLSVCNISKDHFAHDWRAHSSWMDGWPTMEMDAGRAVMKTPATKVKDLFKVVLPTPVATTLSISRAVDNHLAKKYSKWSACPGRSLPVLYWYPSPISPTEPVSKHSTAGKEVVRT